MARRVFRDGTVFDGHRYRGRADVLVEGDRVVAVGDLDTGSTAGAEVVDAAGGLVAPGFTDAHVHTVQGGLERTRCDLTEAGTREEYLSLVGQYAAAHPDRAWVLGGGWAMAAFPGGTPTAADLESVAPGRLVFLPNR